MQPTAEHQRVQDHLERKANWKKWGPYVSERAWGTVREDYSADGTAWEYFLHDHARSRAYRWGEDGIAGICDRHQYVCLALSLWNHNDPILKERLFGLGSGFSRDPPGPGRCGLRQTPADDDGPRMVHASQLMNFTWWVNKKNGEGRNVFQGGFLGLDNISVFDRSARCPPAAEAIRQCGDAYNRARLTPTVKGLFLRLMAFKR